MARKKRKSSVTKRIRQKRKNSSPAWGIFLLTTVIVIIMLFIGDHGIYRLIKIRQERAEVQKQITDLRARQKALKQEENRLETDTDYIEKLAREKYRMARKGERVFKVIEKPKTK